MQIERIGSATLYLGDCREVLPELLVASSVLTDPPYGIGYCSGYRTERLWAEQFIRGDFDTSLRDEVVAALVGRPMLVFGSRKQPAPAGTRMVLTWDKGPALGMGALDLPWKPTSEEIYVLGRGFSGPRDEGSVLQCPPVQSTARNGRRHPNEKPVSLLRRLVRRLPDGPIADPFMGSGSVGEAALIEGFPFIGCEIDQQYFIEACERIAAVVHHAPSRLSPGQRMLFADRDEAAP